MEVITRINGLKTIPVSKTMQAIFPFGEVGFPCQLYHDDISKFYKNVVNWHWQNELEISIIHKGQIELQFLEHTYKVKENEGYIIFPDCMHRIIQVDKKVGIYDTIIFSPEMIYGKCSTAIYQKFYLPIIQDISGVLFFSLSDSWGKKIEQLFNLLSENLEKKNKAYEFNVTKLIFNIWELIYFKINSSQETAKKYVISKSTEKKIKGMLSYIQQNYMNNIFLEDISNAACISKGECCALFKKYLHTSPIKYLMDYRIEQSVFLLLEDKFSVTDCGLEVGFRSINHYISTFVKTIGLTPLKFKQKYLKN